MLRLWRLCLATWEDLRAGHLLPAGYSKQIFSLACVSSPYSFVAGLFSPLGTICLGFVVSWRLILWSIPFADRILQLCRTPLPPPVSINSLKLVDKLDHSRTVAEIRNSYQCMYVIFIYFSLRPLIFKFSFNPRHGTLLSSPGELLEDVKTTEAGSEHPKSYQ